MKKTRFKIFYKFILPLLLFGIVLEILILAPRQIEESEDVVVKKDQTEVGKYGAEQIMKGVHLVESTVSGKEWELWAEQATNPTEEGEWILENLKVRFFGMQGVFYDVTGPKGTIDPQKKTIVVEGDVNTVSSNGYNINTTGVFYNADLKSLKSDSVVRLLGPKTKGESRLELTGLGLNADLKTDDFKILKNIKGKKTLQKGQLVTLSSQTATFNARSNVAFFDGDLITDYGSYRVTGNSGQMEVEERTQKIKKITVIGNARLSDIERFAVADKATLHVLDRKLVLSGAPRLIQNNNQLDGDEIIFFEETSRIQVKRAKAKFDKMSSDLQ